MQKTIPRAYNSNIISNLKLFPIVALIGPRQSGKTTLAKEVLSQLGKPNLYLDLELHSDLAKLDDAEQFLLRQKNTLVCIDEVQRKPDLFPLLRAIVDQSGKNGQFLLLGSASPALLKQSAESLAGRIRYLEISPFSLPELLSSSKNSPAEIQEQMLVRGRFPRSILAASDEESQTWRESFIQTYLERDLPQLGIQVPANRLRRFWLMCCHYHGQTLNLSKIAQSMDLTHPAISHYVEILTSTFMARTLPPFEVNLKKRLVKSPKIYLRDSGIITQLLAISTFDQLFNHPSYGAVWEGFALENILRHRPLRPDYGFIQAASGPSIDLVGYEGTKLIALEIKASNTPKLEKGCFELLEEIKPSATYIVTPSSDSYTLHEGKVTVCSLASLLGSASRKG